MQFTPAFISARSGCATRLGTICRRTLLIGGDVECDATLHRVGDHGRILDGPHAALHPRDSELLDGLAHAVGPVELTGVAFGDFAGGAQAGPSGCRPGLGGRGLVAVQVHAANTVLVYEVFNDCLHWSDVVAARYAGIEFNREAGRHGGVNGSDDLAHGDVDRMGDCEVDASLDVADIGDDVLGKGQPRGLMVTLGRDEPRQGVAEQDLVEPGKTREAVIGGVKVGLRRIHVGLPSVQAFVGERTIEMQMRLGFGQGADKGAEAGGGNGNRRDLDREGFAVARRIAKFV